MRMSLANLIEYVGNGLERIKALDRQKDAEWDKMRAGIKAIREEITATVNESLILPGGVTIQEIEAREAWEGSKKEHPSQLDVVFSVDPNTVKKLAFGSIYAETYKFREQIPTLGYSAALNYDVETFLEDSYFDPRAFREVTMSKKGRTFSPMRFLERKDRDGTLEVKYDPAYKENRFDSPHGVIQIRAGYDSKVWHAVLKEVARKFAGTCQVHISGEDYANLSKGKSFFGKIKANILIRDILEKRTTSYTARKITRAIVAYAAGEVIDRSHSWDSYEGIVTADQLEALEQAFGASITPFVNTVTIPAEVREDHRKVREILRELAAYLAPIQVPGTSPGETRITEEQARIYLEEDLEAIYPMSRAVPLSSGFVHRGMGRVREGSDYERLHLPLLRKLRELTTLDLESCIANHSFDHVYSRFEGMKEQSSINPDKYHLKPHDVLINEFGRVGLSQQVQQDTFQILERRGGEYWKDGYLNIHELYDLHISLLQDLQSSQPEALFQRYLELYRDVPATSLSISGNLDGRLPFEDKGKPSEFPQPFIMNPSGSLRTFGITDGADSVDNNGVGLHDDWIRVTITPSNPCLLPLQQYVLENIGVRFKA